MTLVGHVPDRDEETADSTRGVTALVCTRNRGSSIVQTIESILANTFPSFELIVIDQSTDERTAEAIAPYGTDSRFRYVRSNTQGKSKALNIGLRSANTDIVVITDDDCTVPTDWLQEMHLVFTQQPGVVVVFCNVAAAPHDRKLGFIPSYWRDESRLLRRIRDKLQSRAMGAGMAVRRAPVLEMGGFDEMLGPGAEFQSGDDFDVAVRALLKGRQVFETANVTVIHHGYRTYLEGKDLGRRDWTGIGAAYAKPVKCGCWRCWILPVYEFLFIVLISPIRDLLRLKKPSGLMRICAFMTGFIQALRTPIDRETLCFRKGS